MKFKIVVIILFLSATLSAQRTRVFLLDADSLLAVRASLSSGSKTFLPALKRLIKDADKAMEEKPLSVTTKNVLPPSGDKHDYYSMSRYWWPDPTAPDGKPYIRRDGETNPESETIIDHRSLGTTIKNVNTLALAFYYTGEEKYADRAALLIRIWFLDPETKMNPNLTYAQAIVGRPAPRGTGILDARDFSLLVDAFGILQLSRSWKKEEQQKIIEWFKEYLRWLRESKNGIDESNARNNHGSWYDVQTAAIALFVGDKEIARQICEEAKTKRIAYQITGEGQQPEEIGRTLSFNYSQFNLLALTTLATLSKHVGVDLWNYKTDDGRSITTAIDFLIPYAVQEKKWEWTQIKDMETKNLAAVARRAAVAYGEKKYARLWEKLFDGTKESDRVLLQQGFVVSRNFK